MDSSSSMDSDSSSRPEKHVDQPKWCVAAKWIVNNRVFFTSAAFADHAQAKKALQMRRAFCGKIGMRNLITSSISFALIQVRS